MAGPTVRAGEGGMMRRRISIENERPKVSTSPINSAAMKAPRIEPMPPMTITTNANINTLSPMPGSTDNIGAIMTPAKAASMVPKPNTIMNSRRISMPSAETIRACVAPARTSMPTRVRDTNRYKMSATASPAPMIISRQMG